MPKDNNKSVGISYEQIADSLLCCANGGDCNKCAHNIICRREQRPGMFVVMQSAADAIKNLLQMLDA